MSSEHAELLRNSVDDFVARASRVERARSLRGDPREYDRAIWRQMGELGWLGVLIPETYGGSGLGLLESAVVAQGLARALAPEPYTASAVLAARALGSSANEPLKAALLPRLARGEIVIAGAWQERAGALAPGNLTTRATPFERGFRLNGTKRYVAGAAGADWYLVSAQSDEGLVVACVERNAAGVSTSLEPLADGRHFGTIELCDAIATRDNVVASGDSASQLLERATDHACVIASAELCGVMSCALEMSLSYMKTRVQFGRPIGSFQALQHRVVDLYIQQQLASAVLDDGLRGLAREPPPIQRAALASRVKARCSEAGVRMAREAIQIHGAIGFTDEHDIGLYLKRALVLSAWLGNPTFHRRRYAALARS